MSLYRWIGSALVMGLLLWAMPAAATENLTPTETIKGPINDIILILKDPAFLDPDSKAAQRAKIWETVRPMFDFKEISRRTIGKQWQTFSEDEQQQFTAVFAEFLGNTYIEKLQGEFQDEKIVFTKELVKEPIALVRSTLVRKGMELPIDYRMKRANGQWRVYDILIENGISLVKNYRVQFRSALQKDSPAQLIQRLEEKLAKQRKLLGES